MGDVFSFATGVAGDGDDAAVERNVVLVEVERFEHRVGRDRKKHLRLKAHHHPNAGCRLFSAYELRTGRDSLFVKVW